MGSQVMAKVNVFVHVDVHPLQELSEPGLRELKQKTFLFKKAFIFKYNKTKLITT